MLAICSTGIDSVDVVDAAADCVLLNDSQTHDDGRVAAVVLFWSSTGDVVW